jgi:hypothetical protein
MLRGMNDSLIPALLPRSGGNSTFSPPLATQHRRCVL